MKINIDQVEEESNARLIAAAPALLEAARNAERLILCVQLKLGLRQDQQDTFDALRAAILQATGEEV